MNSRPKQPKYARNKNVLVVGGSGSGKTRFFVKPNLMQMHSSYLVSDPNGYATRQARRHIPMTMADWASKLDAFLQFNDAEILRDKGKVTAAIAKAFAESEFEQYRVIQDRLYQSDFDRLVASTEEKD